MAYELTRAETGANCPFDVTSATRDELLEHLKVHVKMAHPELASKPPSPDIVAKLIHQV
jgi:predicted small metal-binding protein